MTPKSFFKLAGKNFTLTSNGTYMFTGVTVACLIEIDAWHELYASAAYERDGYRFHLVFAGNGHYFKYDGPGTPYQCINLVVEHIESEEAWLHSCKLAWNQKEQKADVRRYRDIALNAPVSEIEEVRNRERSGYSWRYWKVSGENVYSMKKLLEATEEKVA